MICEYCQKEIDCYSEHYTIALYPYMKMDGGFRQISRLNFCKKCFSIMAGKELVDKLNRKQQ